MSVGRAPGLGGQPLEEREVGWIVSMQREDVVRPILRHLPKIDRLEVLEGRGAGEYPKRASETWPEQCIASIVEKSRLFLR